MKQTIFMIALTIFGIVGLLHSAMSGVMVYYLFAVLRPQYIWMWAPPVGVQWSQIVAIPTILAALMYYSSRPPSARSFTAVHGVALLFEPQAQVVQAVLAAVDDQPAVAGRAAPLEDAVELRLAAEVLVRPKTV